MLCSTDCLLDYELSPAMSCSVRALCCAKLNEYEDVHLLHLLVGNCMQTEGDMLCVQWGVARLAADGAFHSNDRNALVSAIQQLEGSK